jgi:hypothetical protein
MYPDLMDLVEKTSNCEIFKFLLRDKIYILKPKNIKRPKEAYLIITGRYIDDETGTDVDDVNKFKKIFPEAEKYI